MKLLWSYRHALNSFSRFNGCRYSSTKTSDPLRILFCGSDGFSIASLRAVHAEHLRDPQSIASIDVVHRPGKRTGRGLKAIREVPIKHVAKELDLRTHEIDTFTGWQPPKVQEEAINLVIAVSFGLLVPPRILNGSKHGGLNVHPSLLPDLYGAAPIYHTVLKRRERTGVTVQTLHPKHFDQGTILAQTLEPGLLIPDRDTCTPLQLEEYLAPLGAQMLVDVLRKRSFVPPLVDAGWYSKSGGPIEHASKVQKSDSEINWRDWSADELLLRSRVLGDLWTTLTYRDPKTGQSTQKRIVIHDFERDGGSVFDQEKILEQKDHRLFVCLASPVLRDLCVLCADSQCLKITSCTVDGGKKGHGTAHIMSNCANYGLPEIRQGAH